MSGNAVSSASSDDAVIDGAVASPAPGHAIELGELYPADIYQLMNSDELSDVR